MRIRPETQPITPGDARRAASAAGLGRVPRGASIACRVGSAFAVAVLHRDGGGLAEVTPYADLDSGPRAASDARLAVRAVAGAALALGCSSAAADMPRGSRAALLADHGWGLRGPSGAGEWWEIRRDRRSGAGVSPISSDCHFGAVMEKDGLRCAASASVIGPGAGGVELEGDADAAHAALSAASAALSLIGCRRLVSVAPRGPLSRAYRASGWSPVRASGGEVRWEAGPDACRAPPEEEAMLLLASRGPLGAPSGRRRNPRADRESRPWWSSGRLYYGGLRRGWDCAAGASVPPGPGGLTVAYLTPREALAEASALVAASIGAASASPEDVARLGVVAEVPTQPFERREPGDGGRGRHPPQVREGQCYSREAVRAMKCWGRARLLSLAAGPRPRAAPSGRRRHPLPAGAIVYHGTSSRDSFSSLSGPAWVSNSEGVARWFIDWHDGGGPRRVLSYRVSRAPRLAVFRSAGDIEDFLEDRGADRGSSPSELASLVCAAGYDGWLIPGNYRDPPGDDVMLCDPAEFLEFVGSRLDPGPARGGAAT